MKMKKVLGVIGVAAASLMMMAGVSLAGWNTCTPAQIGPAGDVVAIQLLNCVDLNGASSPGNADHWVALSANGTDRMMATVLTAMSLGKKVSVDVTTEMSGDFPVVRAVIFDNK